jgi:hypothetical protein
MGYIVIHGNILSGLSFFGPFDSRDSASQWALDHLNVQYQIAHIIHVHKEN